MQGGSEIPQITLKSEPLNNENSRNCPRFQPAIVCKHKYFLLIKKASSRCILPKPAASSQRPPQCTHTYTYTHIRTLLMLHSNVVALTGTYKFEKSDYFNCVLGHGFLLTSC